MLIPFLGCFNSYWDGSAANYIVSDCEDFSLESSGPAKSTLKKTNNKQGEITTFLHENNQPSYADYLRYSRYLHLMKIKLEMMAWLVHVRVIRWWRYFFEVSSKGHT